MQGFGQLWQKTYSVSLAGASVTPAEVIRAWKAHYASFWPATQRFYSPVCGIEPGQIGLISGGMGPIKASTGVMVIYSDDTSFTFMNPEGHPWAGLITFSAAEEAGVTAAQVSLLIRANDPIWEVGFRFFGGSRFEDQLWTQTLRNLAAHFGVDTEPQLKVSLLDPKRPWRNAGNIRHNAAVGTTFHALGAPFRRLRAGTPKAHEESSPLT